MATTSSFIPKVLRHTKTGPTRLPLGMTQIEHRFTVPLRWPPTADTDSEPSHTIEVYCREVFKSNKDPASLPALMFLQGGPGFPSPRPVPGPGWMKQALKEFRLFLLDQRGTGLSTPLTLRSLTDASKPEGYATFFRADSIVHDAEAIRRELLGDGKLTLLGQSFGGFCNLTFMSLYPDSLDTALFTCGLAPVGATPVQVYEATFKRMETRNKRFYDRYPSCVAAVRDVVAHIQSQPPIVLPSGGTLTVRRLLQLGIMMGFKGGMDRLATIFEAPFEGDELAYSFLKKVDTAHAFDTNPVYFALHESIYCDGPAMSPSGWAAHTVFESLAGSPFDPEAAMKDADSPVFFTGEMVFPHMCEDYAELQCLKDVAGELAAKADWGPVYDKDVLKDTPVNVAALVAYDDIYVERKYSEDVAELLGKNAHIWVTNEFQHSGLHETDKVFTTLLAMARGETDIPS